MEFSLLVLILKKLVILPYQEIKIELKDSISKKIIKISNKKYNGQVLIVAPIDSKETSPSVDDLPKVGVVAKIKSAIELSNGNLRVTLKGEKRVSIFEYSSFSDDILISNNKEIILPKYDKIVETATIRKLKDKLNNYIESSTSISNSILKTISEINKINILSDVVATFLPMETSRKLEYMQEINGINRAIKLIEDISLEIKILELDKEIDDKLEISFNKNQEEFYLKEKINEIKKTLGTTNYKEEEIKKYRKILNSLKIDELSKKKINAEIDKYEMISDNSPEESVVRNYLDWIVSLPWNTAKKENLDHKKVLARLNKSHYGLDDVKSRISDYVFLKTLNNEITNPVICLVGPPGVGKTTIAASIADALNRDFYKISVSGLNDSNELIGNRRTYLGALPGKIISGLRKVGSNNPVILIDEVDKMVKDYKGDPASVLLDILDTTQNKYFVDNYIEEPFDLSNVLFILTANCTDTIPTTLLDRLEIIELSSYTEFEKLDIAKKYILPNIYDEYKVEEKIKIKDSQLLDIITSYTLEAGVRDLDRILAKLIRKSLMNKTFQIKDENIIEYLGNKEYLNSDIKNTEYGVVNSLAYTSLGGKILKVECLKYKGNGNIIVTGSVGEVLNESIKVSLSFIKSKYIDLDLNGLDIHVNLMEGAIKKEGPSCGVAITTALISLLKQKKIDSKMSFTGEISLTGSISKVGGIREKLIAAYNNGIKIVYLPTGNKNDVEKLPNNVKNKLEIKYVSNYEEIYQDLFSSK